MSKNKLDFNGLETLITMIKDFVVKKLDIEITDVKQYSEQYADKLTPIGTIQAFAASSLPNGWLLCDGSAVSRSTYSNLFGVIGTIYGNGDGSSTFNLPNLTDRFIQGNSSVGTIKNAGLPNITGWFQNEWIYSSNTGTHGAIITDTPSSYGSAKATGTSYGYGRSSIDASKSSSIYGSSSTVQPPSITLRYIIRY